MLALFIGSASAQISIESGSGAGYMTVNNPTFKGSLTSPLTCTTGAVGSYCPPSGALLPANTIQARFIKGVDCEGTRDSAPALNALTNTVNTISYKILSFKGCSQILLNSQWLIHGQENAEIDFGENYNSIATTQFQSSGTIVSGCTGTAVPMIQVDRSGYVNIHGGSLQTSKNGCTSAFTGAIQFTNSGSGGYTSTNNRMHDIGITINWQNSYHPTGWVGVEIHGGPNQEEFHFDHLHIGCQNSPSSIGFLNNDGNADSTLITNSTSTGCMWPFDNEAGAVRLFHVEAGGAGYPTFGAGAAILKGPFSVDQLTCGDGNGTMMQVNAAGNAGGTMSGVGCGINSTIDPNAYWITLGDNNSIAFFEGNSFLHYGGTPLNNTILGVGTISAATYGPLGGVAVMAPIALTKNINFTNQIWQRTPSSNYSYRSMISENASGVPGVNDGWFMLPEMVGIQGNHRHSSAASGWIASLWNGSANVNDGYWMRNISTLSSQSTLALNYSQASGMNMRPTLAIQPSLSGISMISAQKAGADNVNGAILNKGTAGTTTYSYVFVALAGCGHSAPSTTYTTTTGNATLDTTNYNALGIAPAGGAWGFDVYRTAGGATQGKIGTVYVASNNPNGFELALNDTGLAGDGTSPPTGDNSGCIIEPLHTPSSSSEPCTAGQFSDDANYHYVCTATNTWKRVALTAF